jgi:alpha-beta hydrolase superfamily lysophospholipase
MPPGVHSLLPEIRRRYNCDERHFMTGYSGGGFLTHLWLQHHSDQLAGACLGSANYLEYVEKGAVPPKDGGCPVLIVSGSLDSAGKVRIFPQSDQAHQRLRSIGFKQAERRHLEGRDHEAFYELGLELLAKIRAPAKKS